ncbi:uncharacterized protein K441DRAFT_580025 [Cenococcum geophilum 1.58]|uniref:uncharacterized protein n=1 Tax=Cenococcum geophilum 1.58 TaxID=794803 RepID=UPI00358E4E9D|nr:hypothetical protein K441DRAFT_580025 [Cenococcum geophilum 1.58]
MLPVLQPSRPKYPPQPGPSYLHQQTRSQQQLSGSFKPPQEIRQPTEIPGARQHRNQLEAMPPFGPMPQAPMLQSRVTDLMQHRYDSAIRHPVFFTEQLRKPPFPLPENASHGLNPVAHGYITENRRPDAGTGGRIKL